MVSRDLTHQKSGIATATDQRCKAGPGARELYLRTRRDARKGKEATGPAAAVEGGWMGSV